MIVLRSIPYFRDISNSPVYLVIFAAHSVPGAFPAGSDDFSKSPLRRTMSSTQSGHYHSALIFAIYICNRPVMSQSNAMAQLVAKAINEKMKQKQVNQ